MFFLLQTEGLTDCEMGRKDCRWNGNPAIILPAFGSSPKVSTLNEIGNHFGNFFPGQTRFVRDQSDFRGSLDSFLQKSALDISDQLLLVLCQHVISYATTI
jgi:hypothetical protein